MQKIIAKITNKAERIANDFKREPITTLTLYIVFPVLFFVFTVLFYILIPLAIIAIAVWIDSVINRKRSKKNDK